MLKGEEIMNFKAAKKWLKETKISSYAFETTHLYCGAFAHRKSWGNFKSIFLMKNISNLSSYDEDSTLKNFTFGCNFKEDGQWCDCWGTPIGWEPNEEDLKADDWEVCLVQDNHISYQIESLGEVCDESLFQYY